MNFLFQGGARLRRDLIKKNMGSTESRPTKLILPFLASLILFFTASAMAQTTNVLTDAEIQGRSLAQKILNQRPVKSFTNTGVLQIRATSGKRVEIPIQFDTSVTESNWQAVYSTRITSSTIIEGDQTFGRSYFDSLTILHFSESPNYYIVPNVNPPPTDTNEFYHLVGNQLTTPFANSDFWLCDLGLEFFHWPQQKVLKKEIHRSCACTVLESTNPNPSTNDYSRVVSWVDSESLGIVEAYAYDVNGKKLKNFYPKDIKKVNGQWQVQTLVMENLQTGSKSRLEFDLKK